MTSAAIDPNPAKPKTWTVGTLVYDRRTLFNVFVWMLWGDFCLYLMDAGVGNNLLQIQLKKFGASNTLFAIIKTSVIEVLIIVLVPIVSTWSDRHRSRLGRRIPFMLYATLPLALFLSLVGFSPSIASWLKSVSPNLMSGISAAGLTISLLTITYVGYKFFDVFPQTTYYYLWADVIPPQLMGTFGCLFRVFSTAGVFVFNRYLLKYCEDYPGAICAGASGLFLTSFLLLCWRVREGQYPPPPPVPDGSLKRRTADSILRFFRESFSHSFYWKYYLFTLCFNAGFIPFRDFLMFYGREELKMDLATFGNVMAARDVAQIVIFLCLGPIVDRLHPLRAGLFGYVLMFVAALCSFLFIRSAASFGVWVLITFATVAIFQGATTALGPLLLPRSHYGQFCAASALIFHFGQMVLTPVLGLLTDRFGNAMVFPWFFTSSLVGIVFLSLLYRDWKKYGGEASYAPPSVR